MIIANVGFQRSGKTLVSIYIARKIHEITNCELYSNFYLEGFKKINKISEVLYNDNLKICLLDEAYMYLDSRNYKKNIDITLFLNTLAKKKTLLIVTAPRLDMLDKRLREQTLYVITCVEKYKDKITFRIYDVIRDKLSCEFNLQKNDSLFKYVNYNTYEIPDLIEIDV